MFSLKNRKGDKGCFSISEVDFKVYLMKPTREKSKESWE